METDKQQQTPSRSAKKSSAKKNQNSAEDQKRREEDEQRAREEREEMKRRLDEERQRLKDEQEKREAQLKEEQERRDAELKEAQERREQEEKERQVENFMFLRYLKQVLQTNSKLEQAKETLFSHRTFNVEDAFALLDVNKSGVLSAQEFHQVFSDHNINIQDIQSFVHLADKDDDGVLNFAEVCDALSPAMAIRKEPMYNLSVEQRKIYQQGWMETLAQLIDLIVYSDSVLENERQHLQLAGENIFDNMDTYKQGYVSMGQFEHWVADNCGYQVKREDLAVLQRHLDSNSDYRITRDEFINSVSPAGDDEDEEEADDQQQSSGANWTGHYTQKGKKHVMEFKEFKFHGDGQCSASGKDDAGEWSLTGSINFNSVDDKGMMDISFDKVYPSWTIFYHGKINTLKTKMTGHWGFKKGGKDASFTIEIVKNANATKK